MKENSTSSKEFTSLLVKRFAHCVLVLILYSSPLIVTGQLQLLKDVDRSEEGTINEYSFLTSAGKYMYFISNGELWKSNGTTKYTVRMKPFKSISNLTMSGSTLYFTADDGQSGLELWKSNGAPANTVKVKDIVPGVEGSSPAYLTDVNGTLYFSAYSKSKGTELWKSDGTAAGTVMVKDISRGSADPQHLVNYNGTLFFAATSPTGFELWRSDGTANNTVLVKDMIAGPQSSYPSMLTVSNDKLFFVALHAEAGRELWVSDGTSAGTQLLKDIFPGSRTSEPKNLIHANEKLMFSANDGVHGDELWASDGTTNGTALVKDLNPGPAGSNNADRYRTQIGHFTNIRGLLYFIGSIRYQDYIYRSDGTAEGTVALTTAFGVNGSPADPEFTYRNGYVYFFNSETYYDHIYSLYKMPYTGKMITRVVDLQVDTEDYVESDNEMIFLNGALFFPGRFSDNYERYGGYELIRSDGTFEGTVSIHDTFTPTMSSDPREMITAGGRVYSLHYTYLSYTPSLYSTDGTPEGTFEIRPERYHYDWEPVGNDLYFSEELFVLTDEGGAYRWQLSKTSGTPETTHIITVGERWSEETRPEGLTNVNGTLYYFNALGEVWKTDGTTAGTVMLRDLFKVHTIVNVDGQAFIIAANEHNDVELWKSDTNGMTHIRTLNGSYMNEDSLVPWAVSIGNLLYFLATDAGEYQIWRSDGTSAGTYKMFGPEGYPDGLLFPYQQGTVLIKYQEQLYFSDGDALFKASDDGYTKVADMPMIRKYVEHNEKLFLFTHESILEVYVSDGTTEGTALLHAREIENPSYIDYALVGDYVYFNAIFESQLWRTDGTACRTSPVDVGAATPFALEGLGNDLIFGGYKVETGQELYVYHNVNSIPGPACEEEMFVAAHDSEVNQEEMLTAYPNPFADSFTLKVAENGGERLGVAVYTSGGMPVERLDDIAGDTGSVHLGSGWPKGHYIIKVRTAERVDTYHVVKE